MSPPPLRGGSGVRRPPSSGCRFLRAASQVLVSIWCLWCLCACVGALRCCVCRGAVLQFALSSTPLSLSSPFPSTRP